MVMMMMMIIIIIIIINCKWAVAGWQWLICTYIRRKFNYLNKKEELPEEWKESIIVPIHKKGVKQTVIIIEAYHFCQPLTKFYPTSCSQG